MFIPRLIPPRLIARLIAAAFCFTAAHAQTDLSVHWEELTGPDFIQAIRQAQGVCVLPFGPLTGPYVAA